MKNSGGSNLDDFLVIYISCFIAVYLVIFVFNRELPKKEEKIITEDGKEKENLCPLCLKGTLEKTIYYNKFKCNYCHRFVFGWQMKC